MSGAGAITTHVVDPSLGRPARGLRLRLERLDGGSRWELLGEHTTNADGRAALLTGPGSLTAGCFRIVFWTGEYFTARGVETFYPRVTVEFEVRDADDRYHVPLLVSPFGYSTYRGS
jgi:5-hydroxyisourate hydrolase